MPQVQSESSVANGVDAEAHAPHTFWALTLGSMGVVFGDIGTSPLYAFRVALQAAAGPSNIVVRESVLGVLSLILWALILVVTCKYVLILLRADNKGEGGTLSLMALAQGALGQGRIRFTMLVLGMIAASLFYGDALITPAISVLSAVEGLEVGAPQLQEYVVPLTVLILFALFAVQSRGTARVASLFGPIMTIWFVTLGALGLVHIADEPGVFAALNPMHGINYLASHGFVGLVTLGAVFLAVTGAEALYADLGHFGRKPIATAWLYFVLPALVLNYFGQGALVLSEPTAIANPFYRMVPSWGLYPMILLATAATIIASQAVITGAFSLTNQAVQLGLLPRIQIKRTSATQAGQIYIPRINTLLLVGVVLLVLLFRSSGALAAAYGVAVTGTMLVDGLMGFTVIWRVWKWSLGAAAALMVPFVLIDFTFLIANLLKVPQGGWVPLLIGGSLVTVMLTWRKGADILMAKTRRLEMPVEDLIKMLEKKPPPRVPGTAVFLTAAPESAPTALLHSLKHYKVLHDNNVILTIVVENVPRIALQDRVEMQKIGEQFMRVVLHFGFMERPNIPKALAIARKVGWSFDIMSTSFFLSRRVLRPDVRSGMPAWQDNLFIFLAQTADDATSYFQLPTDRVVEIGTQVTV
ncbi:potassium transporter Kup [Methyloceanibacter sp.]|uniref:potassium transporter Kup n=1 Tax=Methyloceanibacter sp. TaxID=1965321 RepID=UPI002D661D64|nr:potassium transporter Kup [Methyloceanibacter sp.]HZP10698.1 potassium transporter Kup [Methyloceanibacter sp.]